MASSQFFSLLKQTQPIAVKGKARINAVFAAKVSDNCVHRPRIATYDRGAAMSENRARYVRFGTPFELRRNGSMAD
jgi:hypothetical protein